MLNMSFRVWTNPDPEVHKFKGIPLRCVPYKALLLSRNTYLQHIASKVRKGSVDRSQI